MDELWAHGILSTDRVLPSKSFQKCVAATGWSLSQAGFVTETGPKFDHTIFGSTPVNQIRAGLGNVSPEYQICEMFQ